MTIKEKADNLIKNIQKKYRWYKIDILNRIAIASVEHTIEVLNKILTHDKERYGITSRGVTIELDDQTELLTELKSRL